MYLDGKLNFLHYIKEKTLKINIGIGVLRKLRHILTRHSLITIYKSFVRPLLITMILFINIPIMKTLELKRSKAMLLLQLQDYVCYKRNIANQNPQGI